MMVIDWAGGGNGYEEVNRGVSMVIIKKTQTLLLFKEVSFLLFFSGLNASLRSVSFS